MLVNLNMHKNLGLEAKVVAQKFSLFQKGATSVLTKNDIQSSSQKRALLLYMYGALDSIRTKTGYLQEDLKNYIEGIYNLKDRDKNIEDTHLFVSFMIGLLKNVYISSPVFDILGDFYSNKISYETKEVLKIFILLTHMSLPDNERQILVKGENAALLLSKSEDSLKQAALIKSSIELKRLLRQS